MSEDKECSRKKELQDRAFFQWVNKKNEEERVGLDGFRDVESSYTFVYRQERKHLGSRKKS